MGAGQATLIAVTILGESPQPTALAGGALVLAGIAAATGRIGLRFKPIAE